MQLEEAQNITKNGYVDYDAIIQKNAELTEENKRANVKIESLIIEINNQKHIIALLRDGIYGKRSEKLDKEALAVRIIV